MERKYKKAGAVPDHNAPAPPAAAARVLADWPPMMVSSSCRHACQYGNSLKMMQGYPIVFTAGSHRASSNVVCGCSCANQG